MSLLAAAVAWLLCAGSAVAGLPPWLGGPAALACAALLPARAARPRAAHCAVAAAVVVIATMQLAPDRSSPAAQGVARLDGEVARLRLRAEGESDPHPAYQSVDAATLAVESPEGWRPMSGRVRLTLPATMRVLPGDTIEAFGRINAVSEGAANGYAAWLQDRGVAATMAPRSARLFARASPAAPWRLWRWLRDGVASGLNRVLPPREAAFAAALLFGARHALPRTLQADLAAGGASHLVTISAFNLMLLYGVLVAGAAPLLGRKRALVLALSASIAYAAATGGHPAAIRGLLIIALLTLAAWTGRPYSPAALLLLAAAAMTVPQARLLRDIAFQLTFVAAAGIAVLAPALREVGAACSARLDPERCGAFVAAVSGGLVTSLAVWLATAPALAAQFGSVPLYSPVVNGLLNPFAPLLTAGALAAGALAALSTAAGAIVAAPLWLCLRGVEALIHGVAGLPAAQLPIHGAGPGLVFAWYAALLTLIPVWQWRERSGKAAQVTPARKRPLHPAHGRRLRQWSLGFTAASLIAVASVGGPHLTAALARGSTSAAVEWIAVDGGPATLIRARGGERLLALERATPAAAAQAVEEATDDGVGVTTLIWIGAPSTATDDLRATAAALHAGAVLRATGGSSDAAAVTGQGASSPRDAPTGATDVRVVAVPAGGRQTLALGGGDELELLDDGHGQLALVLALGGQRLALRATSSLLRLLDRWREPTPIAALVLRRRALSANRELLDELHPALALLEGHWTPQERRALQRFAGGLRLIPLGEASRLRSVTQAGHTKLVLRVVSCLTLRCLGRSGHGESSCARVVAS